MANKLHAQYIDPEDQMAMHILIKIRPDFFECVLDGRTAKGFVHINKSIVPLPATLMRCHNEYLLIKGPVGEFTVSTPDINECLKDLSKNKAVMVTVKIEGRTCAALLTPDLE